MSIQKIRRSVLAAALMGGLAVSGLLAGRLLARQGEFSRMHADLSGAPHMFRHLAKQLDLSADQQTQIRGIFKNHADDIETHVKAGMNARHALHQALLTQPIDEAAIRSLAMQAGAAHGESAILFAKIRAEIWPILNADQQAKMTQIHGSMKDRGDAAFESLDKWLRGDN
jgi:Spy/CpxP family protein refolding chaperone